MNVNREVLGMITLLGLLIGYLIHVHERIGSLESKQAERPLLMERRDRELGEVREQIGDVKTDIRELRQKSLCPCHD